MPPLVITLPITEVWSGEASQPKALRDMTVEDLERLLCRIEADQTRAIVLSEAKRIIRGHNKRTL